VLDAAGAACSVTCSTARARARSCPAPGVHLNNMMGEEDLNPLGFFAIRPDAGCRR
jgi:gamma-glutamyltranspeptidase/glutathione hydrolase